MPGPTPSILNHYWPPPPQPHTTTAAGGAVSAMCCPGAHVIVEATSETQLCWFSRSLIVALLAVLVATWPLAPPPPPPDHHFAPTLTNLHHESPAHRPLPRSYHPPPPPQPHITTAGARGDQFTKLCSPGGTLNRAATSYGFYARSVHHSVENVTPRINALVHSNPSAPPVPLLDHNFAPTLTNLHHESPAHRSLPRPMRPSFPPTPWFLSLRFTSKGHQASQRSFTFSAPSAC